MKAEKCRIATLEEIAAFWTEILRSEESDLKDKLKVSELLIKALGGSIEIHEEPKREVYLSPKECLEIIREAAELMEND